VEREVVLDGVARKLDFFVFAWGQARGEVPEDCQEREEQEDQEQGCCYPSSSDGPGEKAWNSGEEGDEPEIGKMVSGETVS
jgi:hypothetical protein